MKKFIIFWDCGFGQEAQVIYARNEEAATKAAYEAWKEDAENNASYSAEPYTQELASDWGLE